MDTNTLETIMQTPEVFYSAIAAGSTILGIGLGYLTGSRKGNKDVRIAEFNRDSEVARQETKRAEYELEALRLQHAAKIEQLRYENAGEEFVREEQRRETDRKYALEDEERQAQRLEVEARERSEEHEKQRNYRLELASRLLELKDGIGNYLHTLCQGRVCEEINGKNEDVLRQRAEYRQQLIEDYEKQGDGFLDELENGTLDLEEFQERVDGLVYLKFPLSDSKSRRLELPQELQGLNKILQGLDS